METIIISLNNQYTMTNENIFLEEGTRLKPLFPETVEYKLESNLKISMSGEWALFSKFKAKVQDPYSSNSDRNTYTYVAIDQNKLFYRKSWPLLLKWNESNNKEKLASDSFLKKLATLSPIETSPEINENNPLFVMLLSNQFDKEKDTLNWANEAIFMDYFNRLNSDQKKEIIEFKFNDGIDILKWAISQKRYVVAEALYQAGATLNSDPLPFEELFKIISGQHYKKTISEKEINQELEALKTRKATQLLLKNHFSKIFHSLSEIQRKGDSCSSSLKYLHPDAFDDLDSIWPEFHIAYHQTLWMERLIEIHPQPSIDPLVVYQHLDWFTLYNSKISFPNQAIISSYIEVIKKSVLSKEHSIPNEHQLERIAGRNPFLRAQMDTLNRILLEKSMQTELLPSSHAPKRFNPGRF